MKNRIRIVLTTLLMLAVMTAPALALQNADGSFSLIKSLILAIVIGLVIALIVTGMWKADLKSVRKKNNASDYIKKNSFKLTDKNDLFLYKKLDRQAKPQQNNNSK